MLTNYKVLYYYIETIQYSYLVKILKEIKNIHCGHNY
jgi:hypothetical protein